MPSGFTHQGYANLMKGRMSVVASAKNKGVSTGGSRMNKKKDIKIDHKISRTLDGDLIICDGDSCTFDEIDGLWDEVDEMKIETFSDSI